jgi:hypothetical protein
MALKKDGFLDLDDESDSDPPFIQPVEFNISEINIQTEQQNVDFVIDMLRHDEINMNTPFQRSADLWKPPPMSRFIESMMLKFPIPPFYFNISYKQDKFGQDIPDQPHWQVVDGLQRLSAIRRFIINSEQPSEVEPLRLTGLDFFTEYEGATYDELPRNLKRNIHTCQISLFLIYPNTPKPVKHRIFERVNTGGLTLNHQEIRHALNQGQPDQILQDAVNSALLENGIKIAPGRMRDRELALRHLAFRLIPPSDYPGNMKVFLDEAMEKLNDVTAREAQRYIKDFASSVRLLNDVLGSLAFRKEDGARSLNRSLFDSYTVVIAELSLGERRLLRENAQEFILQYKMSLSEKKSNEKYLDSISAATARKDNILLRFSVAKKVIGKVLNA